MKDLKKVDLQDSIIQNQTLQIINFKSIAKNNKQQIVLINSKLLGTIKELGVTKSKLKLSGFIVKFGLPSALIGGYIIGKL